MSEFNSKENDRFIDSSMFVDMFDESNTKCVASVGHNRFSEYMYMLKHNDYIQSKAFTIQDNNKSTTIDNFNNFDLKKSLFKKTKKQNIGNILTI